MQAGMTTYHAQGKVRYTGSGSNRPQGIPWVETMMQTSLRAGLLLCFVPMLLSACASTHPPQNNPRRFDFERDVFAYQNELVWQYGYDAHGKWSSHKRIPSPDYHQHCFVVARSARQFFQNARFDPSLPRADEATYRRLVRKVLATDPRFAPRESERVVIPGYPCLRAFSSEHVSLLKNECGGAWQSYFQRGHWRIVFPFSRRHQSRVADQLVRDLQQGRPPVVHVVRFPQLTINHAVLVFDAHEKGRVLEFSVYDPNDSARPSVLTFDRDRSTFFLPANDYFPGGKVNAYEIYRSWDY